MIDIRPFDPHAASPAEWAEVHAYRRQRAAEEDPGEPVASDAEHEHGLRRAWPLYENQRHFARIGAQIAGSVGVSFRRPGTEDYETHAPYVFAWGGVLVAQRRRGIGVVLVRQLLEFMRAREKTIATMSATKPDGHAFLAAVGAVEKHRAVENRLALAGLDRSELAQWEAAGAGLTWERHPGRLPMGRLAQLLPQLSAMFADVPIGALDVPALRLEKPGYVARYEEMDRDGSEHFMVLLMDGETVAAVCEAGWDPEFPDRAYQELTAVARPWRGRGLAKAVKAAMLRLLRERHPELAMIVTFNAEVNAPMLSINNRLGFAVHERTSNYQIDREKLAAWLAGRDGGRTS